MKTLIATIPLLLLTLSAIAQRRISYNYTEITKAKYDSCSKTQYLVTSIQVKKLSGNLTVPILAKTAKVFQDDNSDENFHEFEYLGDIEGTNISLVKRTDYNSEKFYLLNRSTGFIDTLIGQPASSLKA